MQEFLTLALIHFLAVVAPGPDFAVAVRQSLIYGRRAGILTAIGIGAGISIHVVYTLLGFSALLQTNSSIMRLAEYIGGAYLVYLGFNFIRHAFKTPSPSATAITPDKAAAMTINTLPTPAAKGSPAPTQAAKFFMLGFFTNATNPKATLFFLAVFTTIVSSSTPLYIQATYGLWMCLVTALWFVLVSLAFTDPRIHQKFMRSSRYFEGLIGLLLLILALRLFWPS